MARSHKGWWNRFGAGAKLCKQLRALRAFVGADDKVWPVGPSGFVPRSARVDPARGGGR